MLLTSAEAISFYLLLDSLSLYAKERFHIPDFPGDVYDPDNPLFGSEFRCRVGEILWSDPQVIDDFARENPFDLPSVLLNEALGWKVARNEFYIYRGYEDGFAIFEGGPGAFAVTGLAQEISSMITQAPCMVSVTLLPYDNKIVYDTQIAEYSVALSDNVLNMMAHEVSGEVVSCAADFIAVMKEYNERAAQKEMEELWDDITYANERAHGKEQLAVGFHRGCLAGLSEEERNNAIESHIESLEKRDIGKLRLDTISERAYRKAPQDGLCAQLLCETKERLVELCDIFEVSNVRRLKKDEVVKIAAQALTSSVARAKENLTYCPEAYFNSLVRVYESKEDVCVTAEEVRSSSDNVIFPIPPYTALFLHKGVFTLRMSSEVRILLDKLDFDEIRATRQRVKDLVDFAGLAADLCGVIRLDEFLHAFEKRYGYEVQRIEAMEHLLMACMWGVELYTFWSYGFDSKDDSDEIFYLMSLALSDEYVGLESDFDDPDELDGVEEYRMSLARRHKTLPLVDFTRIPLEMDAYEWRLAQPGTLRMREYLDAHVPDGEDDFFFAENIIEGIMEIETEGSSMPRDIIEYLSECGVFPDDERAMQELLNHAMNMVNDLPIWENNGCSPREVMERDTGQKMFFNEDGSPMKVGRNDPCPCGSGKKYKKCCGQ